MKRAFLLAAVLAVFGSSLAAADIERDLESRWLGAWVVTTVETYSDCSGTYTDNRVNGRLVSSHGRVRFQPGELVKVDRVNARRTRLDLHLSVSEPVLRAHEEGPFTLHDEARCRIELELELPRNLVRAGDVRGIEKALAAIVQRNDSAADARRSAAWNRREREPYPDDYEETLAAHAAWKAEQLNAAVQARLDRALQVTSEIGVRLSSDAEYLAGFAQGVENARTVEWRGCPDMVAFDLSKPRHPAARPASRQGAAEGRSERGFDDGRLLALGLELMRRLPQCFVPVPQAPASRGAAGG